MKLLKNHPPLALLAFLTPVYPLGVVMLVAQVVKEVVEGDLKPSELSGNFGAGVVGAMLLWPILCASAPKPQEKEPLKRG